MKCPYCHFNETKVLDKRETEDNAITRRRRECLKCAKRFTTYEKAEADRIIIVKKDGRRQEFSVDKLRQGIVRACEKRPVSHDKIEKVIEQIEKRLYKRKSKEISSRDVGELVMKALEKLDKVAYIRFASVYRSFADLTSFEKELSRLIKQ